MLEKKQVLRKIELTFTDDKVHPQCHFVYDKEIVEDGSVLMRQSHREVKDLSEARLVVKDSEIYSNPDLVNGAVV